MSTNDCIDRQELAQFVRLSSELTGFQSNDLWGTGLADCYFEKLRSEVGTKVTAQLPEYADDADQVLSNGALIPVARAVIKLWYVGSWCVGKVPDGEVSFPVSATSYVEALAWRALGGHTQGARQPGYGSWTKPPAEAGEKNQ